LIGIGDLERLQSGNSQFQTKFDWGEVTVHLQSSKGVIQEIKIYSDCFMPQMIDKLMLTLQGCPYSAKGILDACARTKSHHLAEDAHPPVDQFCYWFISNIKQTQNTENSICDLVE